MQPTRPEPMTITIHEPDVEWVECWVNPHGQGVKIHVLGEVGAEKYEVKIPLSWDQVRQLDGWLGAAMWHNGGT